MPELDLQMKDFSLPPEDAKPKPFTIGADTFFAPPVIPPVVLAELAGMASSLSEVQKGGDLMAVLEKVATLFDGLLTEETAPRFRERLLGRTDPIDLHRQAIPILQWLMEVYGLRPTQPSSSSANGLDGGGGGSTDPAQSGESIL
jgi:hypothetical protein